MKEEKRSWRPTRNLESRTNDCTKSALQRYYDNDNNNDDDDGLKGEEKREREKKPRNKRGNN